MRRIVFLLMKWRANPTPTEAARRLLPPRAGGVHETGGPGGVRAAAARRAAGLYHVRAYAGSAPARWLPQLRAARLSDGLVSAPSQVRTQSSAATVFASVMRPSRTMASASS